MGIDITVLVPVYQRPHRVIPLLESYEASRPRNTEIIFIASPEDTAELDALEGAPHIVMRENRRPGDWARKINYGYKATTAPWMLLAADDVRFRPGWDTCLRRAWRRSGKRVLGTSDLNPHSNPAGIYSPHPLVARTYADDLGVVDQPRQVVCEKYNHNYPDRELSATAISRDEWLYVPDAIIEHLHPAWTDTPPDPTYELGSRYAQRDYKLHIRRHRLWARERRIRLAANPH